MTVNQPEGDIAELRTRLRAFIDDEVIPAEPVLAKEDEVAHKTLGQLRSRAKELDLWALGHPADVGGGEFLSSTSCSSTKSSADPNSASWQSARCRCRTL